MCIKSISEKCLQLSCWQHQQYVVTSVTDPPAALEVLANFSKGVSKNKQQVKRGSTEEVVHFRKPMVTVTKEALSQLVRLFN